MGEKRQMKDFRLSGCAKPPRERGGGAEAA